MPETFKQVAEKLKSSSSVLVALPPSASPDLVAAGLALANYLKRLQKDAIVVSSDGQANAQVSFLSGYGEIARELSLSKGFVINVSTKRAGIGELSYKKETDKLVIHLKPKSGEFAPEDVTFSASRFPYDAVVVLGAPSLESLGGFYSRNADLFFETPVVNVDFRGSNNGYGQFNLIELNATSVSEIVFDLMLEMEREMVDQATATSLLAGIISETNSFQHGRTTPQAFIKASQLIGMGASQPEIVNQLYKNKTMGFLKLWGRVLARLKSEPESFMVHSSLTRVDLEKSGATQADAANILKQMIFELSFSKIQVFMLETDAQVTEVQVVAPTSINLQALFSEFKPQSPQPMAARFSVPLSLASTQEKILQTLRQEAQKLS